ncbi:HAD hydrolase-like protein [Bacillus timonensis]|nr:HAD hydrolase-like protein [Bacillus timonensis]
MLNDIKAVIFDLDGTLYEDTHHFEYYANRLREKLIDTDQGLFIAEYKKVISGNHALKIGRVFDVKRDLILVQKDLKVVEAFTWDGGKLSNEQMKNIYKQAISFDFDRMLNIGDLWWVPVAVARHFGMDGKDSYKAFLETRRYMMGPHFRMKEVSGLSESIATLKKNGIKTILLTNSPEEDSRVIIEKLNMESHFDKKIFDGTKPLHTIEHINSISKEFNLSYSQMLSVGDNWINEIRPAQQLGCRTIFIDSFKISQPDFSDYIVNSISNLVPILNSIVEK